MALCPFCEDFGSCMKGEHAKPEGECFVDRVSDKTDSQPPFGALHGSVHVDLTPARRADKKKFRENK